MDNVQNCDSYVLLTIPGNSSHSFSNGFTALVTFSLTCRKDFLDGGSALLKASYYTQGTTIILNAQMNIHASSWIRTHDACKYKQRVHQ
jgi:hypothetical protein